MRHPVFPFNPTLKTKPSLKDSHEEEEEEDHHAGVQTAQHDLHLADLRPGKGTRHHDDACAAAAALLRTSQQSRGQVQLINY